MVIECKYDNSGPMSTEHGSFNIPQCMLAGYTVDTAVGNVSWVGIYV